MNKYIRLELRRNSLRPYLIASAIICLSMTGLLFLFAYAAQIEMEPLFQSYTGLFLLNNVLGLISFGVLSAAMYSRFIIGEYGGKRAVLLFSYPVSRRKILFSKVMIVAGFTILSALLSGVVSSLVFIGVNAVFPLMKGALTMQGLLGTLGISALFAVGSACIGLIAMRVGFVKMSVPATLVSAFILPSLFGNALIGLAGNLLFSLLLVLVFLIASVSLLVEISGKVNRMEAL